MTEIDAQLTMERGFSYGAQAPKTWRQFPARASVATLASGERHPIAEHETLVLSERERQAFFDALIDPPRPSKRLVRAFAEHRRRVIMGR